MAGTPQRFRYDPSKPIEDQLQGFLAGRNPYGTVGNADWMNVRNPQYYSSHQSDPDESGTTNTVYDSINPDVQLHTGADSPYTLYNGQYAPINWSPTDNPHGIKSPGGVTGYVKPDSMYDYNNLYYDDKYGLLRDTRDTRDPNAKHNAWLDSAILSAVGGVGGWAAGAANAAAGGASLGGIQAPSLARMAITGTQMYDNKTNPGDRPTGGVTGPARQNYGGSNVAGNPVYKNGAMNGPDMFSNLGDGNTPTDGTAPNPAGGNAGGNTGDPSFMNWALGQLGINNPGGLNLGTLGSSLLGKYALNQNNQGYKQDFNNMINVGTGGVTNDDRSGARGLVRGIYDGSISGDQIFDRVPGLRALSDRGAADIGRQMSAHGDADPQSSARMREFVKFNNDLTSKAYGSEMDRAMKVGGYDINPSAVAGKGMDALGQIYGNNRNDILGIAALANRGGQPGGNGTNGGGNSAIMTSALKALASGKISASDFMKFLSGGGKDIFGNAANAGGDGWSINTGMNDGPIDPNYDPNQGWNNNYGMNDPTLTDANLPSEFDPNINWSDLYG